MAKGIVGFMQGLANFSETFRKTAAPKIGEAIGKTAANIGIKTFEVGSTVAQKGVTGALKGAAGALNYYNKHEDEIKAVGKAAVDKAKGFDPKEVGQAMWNGIPGKTVRGVAKEAGAVGAITARSIEGADRLLQKTHIWKKTDLDDSLIGRKFTKGGMALFTAGAMAINAGSGAKGALDRRQGRNDGRIHGVTPSMTSPYDLANQMASTQIGQSFANNAGADGDLVRAVHNMR